MIIMNDDKSIVPIIFNGIYATGKGRQFYMHKDNTEDLDEFFVVVGAYKSKGNEDFVKLKKNKDRNLELIYWE